MAEQTALQRRIIIERNKAHEIIRQARLSIERSRNKITTLCSQPASDWIERQVSEVLPAAIAVQEEAIILAEQRIADLGSGRLNREIREEIEESKREQEEQSEKSARKATKKAAKRNNLFRDSSFNPEQKQVFNQWKDGERQSRREINRAKGDLRRGGQYFWRIVDDFDSKNMAQNLKKMPNNRGYRYRGVDFYGELPAEVDETTGEPMPIILTESSRGQQLIHEITKEFHRTFRKTQRGRGGRRELISETPRKPVGGYNIMDFAVAKQKRRR